MRPLSDPLGHNEVTGLVQGQEASSLPGLQAQSPLYPLPSSVVQEADRFMPPGLCQLQEWPQL